jgi:hypothetical protein
MGAEDRVRVVVVAGDEAIDLSQVGLRHGFDRSSGGGGVQ